jgi:NAD+ synthase (glutamine-hydrolysing)
MRTLRIGLAQINTTVGDLKGNTEKILDHMEKTKGLGVDLVTFPELAITGYPPEDLLLRPQFLDENLKCLNIIVEACSDLCAVVGFVDKKDDIYNAAAIINDGELISIYHKTYLPNYGVFDENRYFQSGTDIQVFGLRDTVFGISICEDIWYPGDPSAAQSIVGDAELIVNISASPYHAEKVNSRQRMLATRAADNSVIMAFNNLVGGQDELIFDGASMIFSPTGSLLHQGKQFEEDLLVADLNFDAVFRQRIHDPRRRKEKLNRLTRQDRVKKIALKNTPSKTKQPLPHRQAKTLSLKEEIYRALTLGVGDYVRKNGFKQVVLGLSGGIDSSLVASIAVDALGEQNVIGVTMPSPYSSSHSTEDAQILADNLGIKFLNIPIVEAIQAYEKMLAEAFQGSKPDLTEENLQARIRGNILMALSNKYGWLVLTTGNKSETSVGYSTLYGDTAGGFAVIKDVPKTLVYELATWRNGTGKKEIIPSRVITKPPSAELRPDQKDTDSLPPYEILDPILQAYVEEDRDIDEIINMGFEEQVVKDVINLVDINEYKRRQSPPGVKITSRALGKDRRLPISNRYRF